MRYDILFIWLTVDGILCKVIIWNEETKNILMQPWTATPPTPSNIPESFFFLIFKPYEAIWDMLDAEGGEPGVMAQLCGGLYPGLR